MDHSTNLSQHVNASRENVWSVISDIPGSASTLSGVKAIQMLSEGPYGQGTRWKELGMSVTRKALAKDLAEIAAKAESL